MPAPKNCKDIPLWVAAINDYPDPLHVDVTPAVSQLWECGLASIQAIMPLLNSHNELERARAQQVLEGVVKRRFGWESARGFVSYESEQGFEALMQLNGNYQATAPESTRLQAIERWLNWLSHL